MAAEATPASTPAPSNLWALVEQQAADRPDGMLAVDEQDRVLTFGEFRTRAERAAAGLRALGVGDGIPVSWQLPTRLESIVLVGALAATRRGAEPVSPDLPRARAALHPRCGRAARVPRTGHVARRRLPDDGAPRSSTSCARRTASTPSSSSSIPTCPTATPSSWLRRPRSTSRATSRCAGSSSRRAPPPTRRVHATPTRRSATARPRSSTGSR